MKKITILLLGAAAVLAVIGGYQYWRLTRPVTYAGGRSVPARSQAEAKRVGYYCPSWDPVPGEVSPYYCMSIDK